MLGQNKLDTREGVLDQKDIINNKYAVLGFIGNGKFGNVFKGRNIHTNEFIALKIDTTTTDRYSKNTNISSNIKYEARILNYLYNKKCKQIPLIYWYGLYKGSPALVMPYYNVSLYDICTRSLHNSSKYNHAIENTNMNSNSIMRTILNILENIHGAGIVHRDIKPHNFMIKNQELFLIDFGMATFYVDEKFVHIKEQEQEKEHLMGTRKYISYHVHSGKEYSRRDDLISAGYLYLFLQNQLFWDRTFIVNENETKLYPETHILHPRNQCLKLAKELSNIEKCLTMNYTIQPDPIYTYLQYVYQLDFIETPNYFLLQKHFVPIPMNIS
jgi:casein kinase 1